MLHLSGQTWSTDVGSRFVYRLMSRKLKRGLEGETYHVCLLPESPVAYLADKRLFTGVDFQVLLEVEPLRVDEEAADGAALVVGPVVVHVHVEVVQVGQHTGALDAVDRPEVVLDLVLVLADRRVCC